MRTTTVIAMWRRRSCGRLWRRHIRFFLKHAHLYPKAAKLINEYRSPAEDDELRNKELCLRRRDTVMTCNVCGEQYVSSRRDPTCVGCCIKSAEAGGGYENMIVLMSNI